MKADAAKVKDDVQRVALEDHPRTIQRNHENLAMVTAMMLMSFVMAMVRMKLMVWMKMMV